MRSLKMVSEHLKGIRLTGHPEEYMIIDHIRLSCPLDASSKHVHQPTLYIRVLLVLVCYSILNFRLHIAHKHAV